MSRPRGPSTSGGGFSGSGPGGRGGGWCFGGGPGLLGLSRRVIRCRGLPTGLHRRSTPPLPPPPNARHALKDLDIQGRRVPNNALLLLNWQVRAGPRRRRSTATMPASSRAGPLAASPPDARPRSPPSLPLVRPHAGGRGAGGARGGAAVHRRQGARAGPGVPAHGEGRGGRGGGEEEGRIGRAAGRSRHGTGGWAGELRKPRHAPNALTPLRPATPQVFTPERWLPGGLGGGAKPTLLSFHHGPFTCLGYMLYLLEAKVGWGGADTIGGGGRDQYRCVESGKGPCWDGSNARAAVAGGCSAAAITREAPDARPRPPRAPLPPFPVPRGGPRSRLRSAADL
jgi:hypothetical protein